MVSRKFVATVTRARNCSVSQLQVRSPALARGKFLPVRKTFSLLPKVLSFLKMLEEGDYKDKNISNWQIQ
jgi:hypothetical protein